MTFMLTGKELKKYLSKQRYLIADESGTSRVAIARCLTQFGVAVSQITLADSLEWAQQWMSMHDYDVLICEYEFGSRSGLVLLKKNDDALKIVMTRNQTDVAAAQAMEHGADVFITKPFTVDSFRAAFVRAVERRLNGESGPLFYDIQPGPRVASLQQAQNVKAQMREETQSAYNSIVGLYDALIEGGHKDLAYQALSKVVKEHAPAPERLNSLFRLAIETRNFEDVEQYYDIFLKADEKSESMIRHACAALIIAGKAFLAQGDKPRAISVFRKAVISSAKKFSFIRAIVLSLVYAGEAADADTFLVSIAEHERNSRESLILNYFVQSKLAPIHVTLQRGRELLSQGIDDLSVYKSLIGACLAARHFSEAESLAMDASRRWPALVPEYRSLIDQAMTQMPIHSVVIPQESPVIQTN